jgi:DNA-binding beta-propeller fold protein YncE
LKEIFAMQAGKSRRSIIVSAASMLMMLSCLGHGWAQTLNGPSGLALDAKGNLYVANEFGNQVLVYNPNYVQQTGKEITSGLYYPVGVAFDSKGNVYVANRLSNGGAGSITQYSSAGVLNTRFSITALGQPGAITVDAFDDLYVLNAGFISSPNPTITIYPLYDTIKGPFLLTTIALDPNLGSPSGIAVHGVELYVGTASSWEKGFVSELLVAAGGFPVLQSTNSGVVALATDRTGDLYVVNGNGEVDFWGPAGEVVFLPPSGSTIFRAGIAVDSARGRVYLSNPSTNQVLVYSTKGTLLDTIQ